MAARGGLTGQTACARTPSWVSPLGSGSPFRPGPGARGSEGCSQRSAALGIRLPGGVTRATESSPRFLPLRLSQDGSVLILRTGSESAWAEAPNLAGRAWRDNRLAAGAVPLTPSV